MSAILIDTCSCKKKEILKIKKKYSKLKKNHFTHRSFNNISCGLDVFYDIKMKAIYKLKKNTSHWFWLKKLTVKFLKVIHCYSQSGGRHPPSLQKNEMKDLKMYINSFYHNLQWKKKARKSEKCLLFNYIPTVPSFAIFQSF